MLPAIGFMIGFYILTRMVENIMKKDTETFVALCSFITIVVCCISMFMIFNAGNQAGDALKMINNY